MFTSGNTNLSTIQEILVNFQINLKNGLFTRPVKLVGVSPVSGEDKEVWGDDIVCFG